MKGWSLRTRVATLTGALVTVVLVAVLSAVALSYRASLRSDLRHRLQAAAATVAGVGSASAAKPLVRGLALEGIAATISPTPGGVSARFGGAGYGPAKLGESASTSGSLMSITQVLGDGSQVTFTASQASVSRSVGRLVSLEAIIGAVALAAVICVVVRATRSALRPLDEIVASASAIAAGDRARRVSPRRAGAEIGTMAAAIDEMVRSLQSASREAVEAKEAMSRFVADAAHELRTPVAALHLTAERLLRDQPPRPERDQIEASLATTTARLGKLVGDLLDLARLDDASEARTETFDLTGLVDEVGHGFAETYRGQITVEVKDRPLLVSADRGGVRRIVENLLDNARAATPDGAITITTRRQGDSAMLTVADNGPGIPVAQRERIFERFARLSTTTTPGTGLGLAIARHLAQHSSGNLTCDPVGPGASFTLDLPIAACTHS